METENKASWWHESITHEKGTLLILFAGVFLIGIVLPIILKNNDIEIPGYYTWMKK